MPLWRQTQGSNVAARRRAFLLSFFNGVAASGAATPGWRDTIPLGFHEGAAAVVPLEVLHVLQHEGGRLVEADDGGEVEEQVALLLVLEPVLAAEAEFLGDAPMLKGWQGKPAQRMSNFGMSATVTSWMSPWGVSPKLAAEVIWECLSQSQEKTQRQPARSKAFGNPPYTAGEALTPRNADTVPHGCRIRGPDRRAESRLTFGGRRCSGANPAGWRRGGSDLEAECRRLRSREGTP